MRTALGISLTVLLCGLAPLLRVSGQSPVFRADGVGVLLDVSVLERGRPVAGLGAADFEVFDNGVLQTVLDVSTESLPIDICLIVDRSESARRLFGAELTSLASRLPALLMSDDRFEALDVGGRILDADRGENGFLGTWATGVMPGDRGSSLFDALLVALIRPVPVGYRRVVLLLTDGRDTSSFSTRELGLAVADRANAVVYVVAGGSVQGGERWRPESGRPTAVGASAVEATPLTVGFSAALRELAERSGGQLFSAGSGADVFEPIRRAIDEFRSRYVLRYIPSGSDAPGWHSLRVAVKGQKFAVSARSGYYRQSKH